MAARQLMTEVVLVAVLRVVVRDNSEVSPSPRPPFYQDAGAQKPMTTAIFTSPSIFYKRVLLYFFWAYFGAARRPGRGAQHVFFCGLPLKHDRCGAAGTSACVQRALLSTPRRWRGVLLSIARCH